MSKFEFRLPDIGEGVTEGEIVTWLVAVGDSVSEDQDMVEVMTDKATVPIGAPKAGKVVALGGKVGDVVPVGEVLIVLEVGGAEAAAPAPAAAAAPVAAAPAAAAPVAAAAAPVAAAPAAVASAVGDIRESLPGMSSAAQGKALAAPATRKLARELGVELGSVVGSGPSGRITAEDVKAASAGGGSAAAAQGGGSAISLAPAAPVASGSGDQRVAIRGMRKRIFENMARAKRTAAHFTYVDECRSEALMACRKRCLGFAEEAGLKLTFLPFIVKAVVAALKKNPALNCLVDDSSNEMILKSEYNIGIAISTDSGLVVPVLRNADRLSIIQIGKEIERLSADARVGKIQREDLGGSSFTITSLGKLGGLFATPVVNYPEVAILGIHEIKTKPVVDGDEIKVGKVMCLSLSFDHRIIDGTVGAAFAQDIISFLQTPDRLLVEM